MDKKSVKGIFAGFFSYIFYDAGGYRLGKGVYPPPSPLLPAQQPIRI